MIIIKNTDVITVLKHINVERTFIEGLKDNIGMIENSSDDVKQSIFSYIKRNGVFNSIQERAHREISSKNDLFQTALFAINNAISLLDVIENKIKQSKVKVFDTTTISYRQKGMFDWINGINFFGGYTSKLIDVCLTQPKTINNYLTKTDFEFINKTVNYYIILLKRLCDSEKNLKRSLEMLSDEIYDPDEVSVIEEIKGKEAASVGLMPHHFNPSYWVKYAIMAKDVRVIKSNREKIDMYAMKLQLLENQRNNVEDPSIERQIEYWGNQIRILDSEINEIENKYMKQGETS